MSATRIKHVFVLMLENRSFDHMFGFSGLTGTDTENKPTQVQGLRGDETNRFGNAVVSVSRGASFAMSADPGHEFQNVLDQLCGPGARYAEPYPAIDSSGFVDSYCRSGGHADPAEIMRCFDTKAQLPVLYQLASEFALCDAWFAPVPGPTWPNRMFVHAASSGGLDHSPTTAEIVEWEMVDGFAFPNGTIFDALRAKQIPFHLYSGDDFPMVAALKGIELTDVHRVSDLVKDLARDPFPYSYVFIEPSYDVLNDYKRGDSQHPLGDVRRGEALVKEIYEALRRSPAWESSLFVVVWDEHGGFYDHVRPPGAPPPGDTTPRSKYNRSGFTFAQRGVRVPAIVVSPLIPKGMIDHRVYDHASIPATLEALFGLPPLTARDAAATSLLGLASLAAPRTDAPETLPNPEVPTEPLAAAAVTRADDTVNADNLPSILHGAVRQDILLAPSRRAEIMARVATLATRRDASAYLNEVQARLRGAPWVAQGVPPTAPTLHSLARTLLDSVTLDSLDKVVTATEGLNRVDIVQPVRPLEKQAIVGTIVDTQRKLAERLARERRRYLGGITCGLAAATVLVFASTRPRALEPADARLVVALVGVLLILYVALCTRRALEVQAARAATGRAIERALATLRGTP